MSTFRKFILFFAVTAAGALPAYSQYSEKFIEDMMTQHIASENPVVMPVVGLGVGYFNYGSWLDGSKQNYYSNYMIGKPVLRINMAMFLSKETPKQFMRLNISYFTSIGEEANLTGTLTPKGLKGLGEDPDKYKNLNFETSITGIGLNIHYNFKHLINRRQFEPFISLGIEMLMYEAMPPRTDWYERIGIKNERGETDYFTLPRYYYWKDGTIRDKPETEDYKNANIIPRNHTDKVSFHHLYSDYKLGDSKPPSVAFPVDVGVDFRIAHRFTLRAATSWHFALGDMGYVPKVLDLTPGRDLPPRENNYDKIIKRKTSIFTFTYLSLHFDLFSDPEFKLLLSNFMEIEDFDFFMYDDSDDDGVVDFWDLCPDTPFGVIVDEEDGCPLDSDGDGVPDYLDREPDSRPGAIVDEYGVEITEDMFIEMLHSESIRRSEVEAFLLMHKAQNRTRRNDLSIPQKFRKADINNDGYISFDEYLKVLNDYFDGNSTYSPKDLNELFEFFFEQ